LASAQRALFYGAEGQRALVDRIALERLGTSEDIANGVLCFASDFAGWITGRYCRSTAESDRGTALMHVRPDAQIAARPP